MTPREPVLSIDFGTTTSSACLLLPGEPFPVDVTEPGRGSPLWPSAVLAEGDRLVVGTRAAERRRDAARDTFCAQFKRDLGDPEPIRLGNRDYTRETLLRAVIGALADTARAELRDRYPGARTGLGRTVLTVPVSYEPHGTLRELMLSAVSGLVDGPVELLTEPEAAAWTLHDRLYGRAPDGGRQRVVLVYDFGGGTFDAALIAMGAGEGTHRLGAASARVGGMDIDTDLAELLREKTAGTLSAQLAEGLSSPETAQDRQYRVEVDAKATAEELKRQLTEAEKASRSILGGSRVELAKSEMHERARGHIAETIACCRRLLEDRGFGVKDLDAVLLTGGSTRMPLVAQMLRADFGPELKGGPAAARERIGDFGLDADLAVVRGAALWARDNDIPRLAPVPHRARGSVLRWDLPVPAGPGPGPLLVHWHAAPGQEYQRGDPLARIRYDGALWDLTAREPGVLGQVLADPEETGDGRDTGVPVRSRQWIATTER